MIFVGFTAKVTLAREIIDGAEQVHVLGEDIPVRAQTHTIDGFSAHAEQGELPGWHVWVRGAGTTFLVHGESKVTEEFALHPRLTADRNADTASAVCAIGRWAKRQLMKPVLADGLTHINARTLRLRQIDA